MSEAPSWWRHVAALASWGWLHTLRTPDWLHTLRTPEKAPGCSAHSGRAAPCRSVHGRLGCGHVAPGQRPLPPPRHRLPFADGSFDVVFSCFSPSPWDEFCRVLRPGGGPPTPPHLAASPHRRTAAPPHRCTCPLLSTPLHSRAPSSGAIIVVRAGATHLQELRARVSADGTWAAREPKEFTRTLTLTLTTKG